MNPLTRFLLSVALALVLTASTPIRWVRAQALPTVQITGVTPNLTSCKVDYAAYPGARDYRVVVDGNTMAAKYAGTWHLDADQLGVYSKLAFATDAAGNALYPLLTVNVGKYTAAHHVDVPALEIEPNGLTAGQHTLIIQAVDELGPAPPANVYDLSTNLPLMNAASMSTMGGEGMDTMLGANAGTTPDGMTSTNGQGPTINIPHVIAQSQPFTVTIPATSTFPAAGAVDHFFDTFPSGTFAPVGTPDIKLGNENFTLTTPAGAWDVQENHCDIRDSRPFIMNNHYMAVDFDGGSPGSNEPMHVAYSAVSISPQKTADFSNGQILDCVAEVDAHTDARRWVGEAVTDGKDPATAFDWEEGEHVNAGQNWLFAQWEGNVLMVDEMVGGKLYAVCGAAGQSIHATYRVPFMGWQMGRGLDNRSALRLFVSSTHFAVYEDGAKEADFDLPVPLPFTTAKVYDVQYLYHSDLERTTLEQNYPYETFWISTFPFSDERHWANCGWEVLPASTPWSSLAALTKLPVAQPPAYVPANPTVTLPANWASGLPVAGGVVDQAAVEALIKVLEGLLPAQ